MADRVDVRRLRIPLIRRSGAITVLVALSILLSATGSHSVAAQASHSTEEAAASSPEAVMIEGPIDPTDLAAVEDVLYFVANEEGAAARTLWRSDGTAEGTYPLDLCRTTLVCGAPRPPRSSFIDPLQPVGDQLFFVTTEGLWRSDGTPAGTILLAKDADVTLGPRRPSKRDTERIVRAWSRRMNDEICDVLPHGRRLLLIASHECMDPYPRQLWVSDGTRRGTRMLIRRFDADPSVLTASSARVGQRLILPDFSGSDSETWVTDGTRRGTRVLKAAADGGAWSLSYSAPITVGDLAFFAVDDGDHGTELWAADGTTRGTRMVRDIRRGHRGSEVWLGDLWPGVPDPVLGDSLLFVADDGVHGRELWLSDGTREGTRMIRDLRPGRPGLRFPGWDPAIADGRAYFVADDGIHGQELWVTDGTGVGTRMVTNMPDGPDAPKATSVSAWGGLALWVVREADGRSAFWRSDGSSDGTFELSALETEPTESDCYAEGSPVTTEPLLYLVMPTDSRSCGLWRTDGTVEGTFTLDLDDGEPSQLREVDGSLYVFTGDPDDAGHLWRTDGSQTGTELVFHEPVEEFAVTADGLFLVAGDGRDTDRSCWHSSCHLWFLPGSRDPTAAEAPIARVAPAAPKPTARAAAMVGAFPKTVDGVALEAVAQDGRYRLATLDPADPDDAAAIAAIEGFAADLHRTVDDLSFAHALARVKGGPAAIMAIHVDGARPSDLVDAVIPFLFSDTVRPARERKTIAGKRVIRVTDAALPGVYPRYVYPDGDTVWLVEADAHHLAEIFSALP